MRRELWACRRLEPRYLLWVLRRHRPIEHNRLRVITHRHGH